ncbi:hypothetical protein [Arthrobacter sp. UYCu712]|uniref:hypothetical protein n=1 Tax=Arthrobacter sp. UYCu712 TaxID=3156340 RepID=UPI00339466C7
MDQATIIAYAVGYIATIVAVLLLFLPTLVSLGLLLLLAGAVRLVFLLLTAMTVGVYRALATLFRTLSGWLPHRRNDRERVSH